MCRSEPCSLPVPLPVSAATLLSADMPALPRPRSQPMKPKLPRKLATSARINLNKYWHALEELMPVSRRAFDESDCNAINENLDNERRLAAMRLSEPQWVGNTGPESPEARYTPAVFSHVTENGKNSTNISSLLQMSINSSNFTQTTKSSSSSASGSSLSLMSLDDSSSTLPSPSCMAEPMGIFQSFPRIEKYPDENTPPINRPSNICGNSS